MLRARILLADLAACLGFFTRLPVARVRREDRSFAASLWAAPVAGAAVGLVGALAYALTDALGLSAASAALLALTATMLLTGCLHEDGLSDMADGFGGGRTRDAKLAIMADSRIGAFGGAALLVSVGLRWSALAALADPMDVGLALLAAHAASRGLLPFFLRLVPAAKAGGLGAGVGRVPGRAAAAALLLGALALLALGPWRALLAAMLLALAFAGLRRLCMRQVGGQTGDVCGVLQQAGETLLLLLASARFS